MIAICASGNDSDRPSIAACVITNRGNQELARLLESLVTQRVSDTNYRIVVVDNHADGMARECVSRFRDRGIEITYDIEPVPGIPFARNRSIRLARETGVDFAAFIDDDEIASPNWIEHLVDAFERTGAEAVTGPVRPIFPASAPTWAERSGLYHRPEYPAGAELDYASTANSAIRLDAFQRTDQVFSVEFHYSGGSDTYLYQQLRNRGGRIIWEPQALVFEHVPAERINMGWLLARNFRHGITLARCDRLVHGFRGRTLIRPLRGAGLIGFGVLEFAAGALARRHRWRRGLTRISRGLGMIAGTVGVTYQEYRRT